MRLCLCVCFCTTTPSVPPTDPADLHCTASTQTHMHAPLCGLLRVHYAETQRERYSVECVCVDEPRGGCDLFDIKEIVFYWWHRAQQRETHSESERERQRERCAAEEDNQFFCDQLFLHKPET